MASGVTIVLVHGAFCDGSSWSGVIPLLARAEHHVLAVQLPLTRLSDDVAVVKAALASVSGPTVLVGHSYGGAVITGAGTDVPHVSALVYIAAYAPAQGETVQTLNARFPATEGQQHIGPAYLDQTVWIDPAVFPQVFAADVDPVQAHIMATVQKPTGFGCLNEASGPPAWAKIPAWYVVSAQDHTINPDAERWMAERMGATTSTVASSHASPVAHPHAIAEVINAAAQASMST